jgi:hypothetical protein
LAGSRDHESSFRLGCVWDVLKEEPGLGALRVPSSCHVPERWPPIDDDAIGGRHAAVRDKLVDELGVILNLRAWNAGP